VAVNVVGLEVGELVRRANSGRILAELAKLRPEEINAPICGKKTARQKVAQETKRT
jgi:hypothetical protein